MTISQAMTVEGLVPVADLGMTLPHEHLHADMTPLLAVHGYGIRAAGPWDLAAAREARWDPGSHPDNYRFTLDALVVEDVSDFVAAGGRTIVDLTPPSLGRDPDALAAIGRASGVHVVMGTGHYLARTHAPDVAAQTEAQIADALISEARDGDRYSGMRPGIFGEIGTSIPVHPEEMRVLRATAWAALATGLAVSIHLHPWGRTGSEVLDVLLGEGLAPERVVLGHLTTAHDDAAYIGGLLERGVFVAFDLFGFDHSLLGVGRWVPSDADVSDTVARLVRAGQGARVLLSHDIGVRTRLRAWGGWGYAHIPRHVVPLLHERGLDEDEVRQLLVRNPAQVLTIVSADRDPSAGR